MDIKETPIHPLVLKVMRLTKPTLAAPIIVTCESSDLPANTLEKSLKDDFTANSKIKTLNIGEFLLVPQNFGSIYLGEIFSSFICIHNHGQGPVDNISLKVDLQTSSQRFMLLEDSNLCMTTNDTYERIIHHEVKEIGTHILVCEVVYNEGLSFRKFFKFQVLKPLDVKTKFYVAESDEVYVEAEVQNTTLGPVCYETIKLKSSENVSITDLNVLDSNRSVFGDINMVDKDLSRQYLYCLSSTSKTELLSTDALNVGILDIVWRANLGDRGHLQTSTLQTMRSHRENVRLSVIDIPNIVKLDIPFRFICQITNLAEYEISLLLGLEEKEHLVWNSKSNVCLDKLQPMSSTFICLQLIPISSGIQGIGKIKLTDINVFYDYTFDNVAHVFVI